MLEAATPRCGESRYGEHRTSMTRGALSVVRPEQPRHGRGIALRIVLDLVAGEQYHFGGGDRELHGIGAAGDVHVHAASAIHESLRLHGTARSTQSHEQRMLQREWIGVTGHDVARNLDVARHAVQVAMVRVHGERSAHGIVGHDGFGGRIGAARQDAQRAQQLLESHGLAAQDCSLLRDIDATQLQHVRRGVDRRHAVAQRMRDTAQQFVMNHEPPRGTRAIALV